MSDSFLKLQRKVLECDGCVSPVTGEMIPFTLHDKVIYTFMLDRNKLFGDNHFESISTIADRIRVSKNTVSTSLNKLKDAGVISATKVINKRGGRERWVYNKVVDDISVYKDGKILNDVDTPF